MPKKRQKKKKPSFVTNRSTGPRLEGITSNTYGTTRIETLEGRPHIVAPMVMITEGVHAGSNGPLYYPSDELGRTPGVWNHKPIVVYHPTFKGRGISACQPHVIDQRKVGVILNTQYDDQDRLIAEAWMERDRLELVDNRVLESIEADRPMEVSTGLFCDYEDEGGVHNGTDYETTARNYRPDHLALLPDKVGACSLADGAGLLVNHGGSLPEVMTIATRHAELLINEMSHDNLRMAIQGEVYERHGDDMDLWVVDVYNGFAVVEMDGKLYRYEYTANENEVQLALARGPEVFRVTEYREADGTFVGNDQPEKEPTMAKKKLVDAVINNESTQWEEGDREFLKGLTDAQVIKMTPVVNEDPDDDDDDEPPAPVANKKKRKKPSAATPEPPTFEDLLANASPEMRETLADMATERKAARHRLISTITANDKGEVWGDEAELKKMKTPMLRKIAQTLTANKKPTGDAGDDLLGMLGGADYSGQGNGFTETPQPTHNSGDLDDEGDEEDLLTYNGIDFTAEG